MQLVSRDEWGARQPESLSPLVRGSQRGTALHYTAAVADAVGEHKNCAGRIRAIQRFHMDVRGWADIAYNFIGCNHGYIFAGRGRGIRSAANGTTEGNKRYHAVVFLGGDNVNRADVTEEGKLALADAIGYCNDWSGVRAVVPHGFFKPTECPGAELRAWISAGMPTIGEDTVSEKDVLEALKSPAGQHQIELAVDHIMSQGLTGNRNGAMRAWAAKLDTTDANVKKILQHLGIPLE